MGCIYKITNTVNKKAYIGKTTRDPIKVRIRDHLNANSNASILVKRAVKKYGKDAFTYKILHEGIIPELLNDFEIQAIKEHNTKAPNGYNCTDGGDGGNNFTEKTRRKISEAQKGKKLSIERRRKISESNKGRIVTEETRQKISKANRGRKQTSETRRKMSIYQKSNPTRGFLGKSHTPESRSKMSASRKGKPSHMKGKTHTAETRRKIAENLKTNPLAIEAQKKATEAAARHNTGRKYSKKHKQAISAANKGKKRSKPIHNRSAIWDDVEEVIRLYTVELKTTTEIALMYGLAPSSGSSVCVLLKANGIKLSRSRKPTRCDIWNRQSEVVSLYTREFKSTKEIADMFEVSTVTVLKVLKSNGVEELRSKKVAAWRHQDEIINLYTAEMKNINEIATIFKTCSDVVSRILESNGVPTRKNENQNHPCYGKPAHNRSPQFTQAHEMFLSLPPDMSVVEKRKHIQENVDGVPKDTISRWVQKWANIRGIQPTHPDCERTHKFFLSLPADMNLNEKRKFLREKMPHVNRGTIYRWVRKWQSELEATQQQAEFQFS